MSGPVGSYNAPRELVAAWQRAEDAELAVLELQKERAALRARVKELEAELGRAAAGEAKSHPTMESALDRLVSSVRAERQQKR